MNVPETMREKADVLLAEFRENHAADEAFDYLVQSCYFKEEIVTQRKMERTMTVLVNVFIVFMLTMIGLLLLHIKSQSEIVEMERRYAFMECFGMRKSERVKLQKKEIARFVEVPMFMAVIISFIFTGITLCVRDFRISDIVAYACKASVIWGIYIVVQLLNMKLIQRNMVKRIEG